MNDVVTVSLDQNPWQRYWNFGPKPVFTWFSSTSQASYVKMPWEHSVYSICHVVKFSRMKQSISLIITMLLQSPHDRNQIPCKEVSESIPKPSFCCKIVSLCALLQRNHQVMAVLEGVLMSGVPDPVINRDLL